MQVAFGLQRSLPCYLPKENCSKWSPAQIWHSEMDISERCPPLSHLRVGCLLCLRSASSSFTPSEEFERLRVKIESRRLRRKRRNHKIKVKAEEYATSAALHPGDEITRRINLASWHHGIYMGGGKVGVPPLVERCALRANGWCRVCCTTPLCHPFVDL